MKKTKKLALMIAVLMLMAVCFAFGVSAETWGDYEYTVLEDGTVEITDYTGNDAEVVIPEEIDERTVTSIGQTAFGFSTISNAVIPDSIKQISDGAFVNCINLKTAMIGKSVEFIGDNIFLACVALETITVDEENKFYSSDSNGVLFNKNKTILIRYPSNNSNTSYIVPKNVLEICDGAFYQAVNLENITITENVASIGEYVFFECISLTNITILNGIKNIYDVTILDTPFLEKVIIKDMDVIIAPESICFNHIQVLEINKKDFADLTLECYKGNISFEEFEKHFIYLDVPATIGTIYCHAGSTAETYAIENGVDYELTHFFEGEWNYDYENNIRTRKCIHCDELQVEELEIEEVSGDNFLLVEETVKSGVAGNVEVLKAFDINLKNCDGVHVQPDGTVKVKLPNDWSKNGTYKVYRVNDDGTLTDMNAYREGSHLVFDTDHFSIYVIVFEGEDTTEEEPETPDTPAEPDTTECDCICHATGFLNRILAIVYKIFLKLLGTSPLCECGIAHY